jgi:hypothetical protein
MAEDVTELGQCSERDWIGRIAAGSTCSTPNIPSTIVRTDCGLSPNAQACAVGQLAAASSPDEVELAVICSDDED